MPPGAEFAWEAFWRLQGDRPTLTTGMAAPMGATIIEPRFGRIPFSAINAYAERYGIVGSGFDLLLALLSVLTTEQVAIEGEAAEERARRRAG